MSIYNLRRWSVNPATGEMEVEELKEAYQGCVLYEGEHNYHDDSDGYAKVWDEEQGKVLEIDTWTTRGAGPFPYATVDATEETKAKVRAWARECRIASLVAISIHNAPVPSMGKRVKVTKGRKVPIGTEGVVVWSKMVNYDKFGRDSFAELRIGLEDADGTKHYTAGKNCEVICPELYHKTREQAEHETSDDSYNLY